MLKTYSKDKLKEILAIHKLWIESNFVEGTKADLQNADLRNADLQNANLRNADLQNANLRYANLRYADLQNANLWYADLQNANLQNVNLQYANLHSLNLDFTLIVSQGDLIVWKKCKNGVLVKLLIPKEAKRSNATGRKCRAEFADVLEIIGAEEAVSMHDSNFTYKVGQRVVPSSWEENRFIECGGGIHFFITKSEAEAFNL